MLGEIMFVSRCEKSMRGIFRPSSEFLRDAVEGTQLVPAGICSWPIAAAALAVLNIGIAANDQNCSGFLIER
jgi:hypothetical protein